jgi:hypothetical protein
MAQTQTADKTADSKKAAIETKGMNKISANINERKQTKLKKVHVYKMKKKSFVGDKWELFIDYQLKIHGKNEICESK